MKQFLVLLTLLLSSMASAQNWEPNYDDALVLAKKTDRPLILVFSGSDWCAPCIKLEREIWQSDYFKEFAAANYILYRADFPRKKKNGLSEELQLANGKLADKFNPNGYFPLVVVVNSQERILGTTSYQKLPPKEYTAHLNTFLQ